MATGVDLRQFALSLPHVIETPHFERTSFRVDAPKGKIFLTMPADESSANLMLDRDGQDMLCSAEPDLFRPVPNKWGEKGATIFEFSGADAATLQSAILMAWRKAAPANVQDAYDGQHD